MPQLGHTLAELFKRAGVNADQDALKVILQNDAIFKAEIPQEVVNQLEGNLMNETIALTKLKPKMKAEILDGYDTHLERVVGEMKMGDDVIAAIKAGGTSEKRVEAAIKAVKKQMDDKISELEKKGGKTPEETQRIIHELNELKAKQAEIVTAHQAEVARLQSDFSNQALSTEFKFKMMKYADKLNLPDEMTVEEKIAFAMTRVNQKVAEGKFKLTKGENGSIRLTDENGADAYDSQNRKLDIDALAEQTLAPVLKKAKQDDNHPLKGVQLDGKASPADVQYQQELMNRMREQGVVIPS